jgi:two-component system, OmpR family, phosphate regulon response regulator PhoB
MAFHVLAVDDEPDFLESLALLLEVEGFRVSAASDGEEALSLFEGGLRPDAVLLDQRMPGLKGTEVLHRLRQQGHAVPAILLSASRDVEELAQQHGFDAWLVKPCSVDHLIEQLRTVLHKAAT